MVASVGVLLLMSQIVVSPDGPITTLTEALRLVPRGGHITVTAGTYREPTIVVERPVTITGRGRPRFDGEGARQILVIAADSVTVQGLALVNVGISFVEDRSAIRAEDVRGCVIRDNHIEGGFFGIYLASVAGCVVERNVLRGAGGREAATGNGIHLWYSRDVDIRDNRISEHRDGIYFEFVEDSRVVGNVSGGNFRYGLHFMFSDGCTYRDNEFRENGAGVAVMYTTNVVMTGNRFVDNWGSAAFGLLLKDITDSEIAHNEFRGNTVALMADGANRVVVHHNEFVGNGWAVKVLANATDSRFTANNFSRNTFDVATNSRRTASTFAGNYWDAYEGYDLDRDGVGDVPHRPVRLFALVVERHPPALILLRSVFVQLMDAAERVVPALTPDALVDNAPRMRPVIR